MIIFGAKGFSKEVLEILHKNNYENRIAFFDNLSPFANHKIFNRFPILSTDFEVKKFFSLNGNNFTIGIGDPKNRQKAFNYMSGLGGILSSTISTKSDIGSFNTIIENGCNICTGVVITNNVSIGEASLINLNVTIGHDCVIGKFVELSPGVNVSGNCNIENFVSIGSNATILPNLSIGENSIIGAGSIVTKDIPKNVVAYGAPAKIVKKI